MFNIDSIDMHVMFLYTMLGSGSEIEQNDDDSKG